MTSRDVRPLAAVDRLEHRVSLRVSRPPELVDRVRVAFQPARFVREVDDRDPRAPRAAKLTSRAIFV